MILAMWWSRRTEEGHLARYSRVGRYFHKADIKGDWDFDKCDLETITEAQPSPCVPLLSVSPKAE